MTLYYFIDIHGRLLKIDDNVLNEQPNFFISHFVSTHWQVDTTETNSIYSMLVHAAALGVNDDHINNLIKHYALDESAFAKFLTFLNVDIGKKEDNFYAYCVWYDDHNEISIGQGLTPWKALVDLIKKIFNL